MKRIILVLSVVLSLLFNSIVYADVTGNNAKLESRVENYKANEDEINGAMLKLEITEGLYDTYVVLQMDIDSLVYDISTVALASDRSIFLYRMNDYKTSIANKKTAINEKIKALELVEDEKRYLYKMESYPEYDAIESTKGWYSNALLAYDSLDKCADSLIQAISNNITLESGFYDKLMDSAAKLSEVSIKGVISIKDTKQALLGLTLGLLGL